MAGKNVNIRPLERDDLSWFTEWNSDINYIGPYEPLEISSKHTIEKWFEEENRNSWWIIEDMAGKPVGQMITGPEGNYQFMGYVIHPDQRNKGYCTEAVELMVDYLFLSKPIVRVQAEANPENKASIRVLEKVGFTFEGVKRKSVFAQGTYNDGAMYSILREEWTPKHLDVI